MTSMHKSSQDFVTTVQLREQTRQELEELKKIWRTRSMRAVIERAIMQAYAEAVP